MATTRKLADFLVLKAAGEAGLCFCYRSMLASAASAELRASWHKPVSAVQEDEARVAKATSRKLAGFLALKAAGEAGLTVPEIVEAAREAGKAGGPGTYAEWESKDVNNLRSVSCCSGNDSRGAVHELESCEALQHSQAHVHNIVEAAKEASSAPASSHSHVAPLTQSMLLHAGNAG